MWFSYLELVFRGRLVNIPFSFTSDSSPNLDRRHARVSTSHASGRPTGIVVLLPDISLRGGRSFPFNLGVVADIWSDVQPSRAFFVSFSIL